MATLLHKPNPPFSHTDAAYIEPLPGAIFGTLAERIVCHAVRRPRSPDASGLSAADLYQHPSLSIESHFVRRPMRNEVVIEVRAVSICGSVLHLLETDDSGYTRFSGPADGLESGVVAGDEMAGRVIAIGEGVDPRWLGKYVTSDSLLPCRSAECRYCARGKFNSCRRACLLGTQRDGAFSEIAYTDVSSLTSIQPLISRWGLEIGVALGAICEPVGVALHAFAEAKRLSDKQPWTTVVFGAGPIGVIYGLAAQRASWKVVLTERNPARITHATRLGLAVRTPDEFDNPDFFDAEFESHQVTVALDACGGVNLARYVASGRFDVLLLLARVGGGLNLQANRLITYQTTISGVRGHIGHVPRAVEFLATYDRAPELITRSLNGIDELYDALMNPAVIQDELKVVCRLWNCARAY